MKAAQSSGVHLSRSRLVVVVVVVVLLMVGTGLAVGLTVKHTASTYGQDYQSQAISPSPLAMTANRTSPLTTHVLDTSLGRPAAEVPIKLYRTGERLGEEWSQVSSGQTNSDGRCNNLLNTLEAGVYKITFDTATYFNKNGIRQYFYPYVDIVFEVQDPNQHYHVPLLLNPFGYSTYRGS
ncbi:5-hydroxyisourate hydrolase-like isoform X2 [Branchiostoma floridae]|uniref:hydroxyisourate hydrolase n=1 Tax=Branchiostoma floridae TaxID=7739 RepID=A0A9J7LGT3_BRAFL|nr:5-hydroxyisourate hydrolase-like isoform X2 [Branchiostoma floridae]